MSTTPEETEEFVRPFRQEFRTAVEAFVRPMFVPGSDPRLVEHVVADMSAAPPEVAVEMMVHAVTNDDAILAALPQLQAPVVAINPDYRPNDIEALRRHGVEAVLMPGVGHFLMLEDPRPSIACSARQSKNSRNEASSERDGARLSGR